MFDTSKIQRYLKRARFFFDTLLSSRKSSPNKGIHILVVDDSKTGCMYMGDILGRWSFKVSFAEGGEQAVELLAVQSFDLVFMDGLMPGVPGPLATSRIRRNERKNGLHRTAIVGCCSVPAYRDHFFYAGADDVLEKPLTGDDLLQAIAKWVPRAEFKVKPDQS